MRARPISFGRLVEELCDRLGRAPRERRTRVAIDGAPAAEPGRLADALSDAACPSI